MIPLFDQAGSYDFHNIQGQRPAPQQSRPARVRDFGQCSVEVRDGRELQQPSMAVILDLIAAVVISVAVFIICVDFRRFAAIGNGTSDDDLVGEEDAGAGAEPLVLFMLVTSFVVVVFAVCRIFAAVIHFRTQATASVTTSV
ncbi:hypothetical protein V5799_029667 [Amblyomma americanum]|uniref:Uncharacterized protein n=1 Tax=Amblyomma americanum TaxID=6943 RepID=A0AAQ4EQE5_AMBAM